MADDYADIVELGFEGLNHFTDKYHDPVADFAAKHTSKLSPFKKHRRDGKRPDQSQRGPPREPPPKERDSAPREMDTNPEQYPRSQASRYLPDQCRNSQYAPMPSGAWSEQTRPYQDLPPPPGYPQDTPSPPQQASRQPSRHDRYEDTDSESEDDYHDCGGGRRERRGRRYSEYGYGHQGARGAQPMAQGHAIEGRGRPQPQRRRSSWSPPRSKSKAKDKRRREDALTTYLSRSNSPNAKYRVVAAFAGALAGGYAGSRVQKDQPVANSVSTVLGAVMGGLGAREAEQAWTDRRRQRRREREGERG